MINYNDSGGPQMRPLFWNRVILDLGQVVGATTLWHTITEPNFDVDEFEKLFGKGSLLH